ncbi:hypothetical protein SDJN02_11231, partial [Cucurbita argyrosperma subsp. argyrosperma]
MMDAVACLKETLLVQDFLLAQILLRQLTMVFIIQVWLLSLEGFAGSEMNDNTMEMSFLIVYCDEY